MNTNYLDTKYSTTGDNVYEVYAVNQAGHISTAPGTVTYTNSGAEKKPRGPRAR